MCDLPKRRNVQIRRICSHTFSSNKGLWACWAKPWIQSAKQPKSLPFPTIEKTIDGTRKMRIIKIDTQVRAPLNSKSPGPGQRKPHQPVPQAQEPQQRRSHPLLWDALSGKWNVMWGDSLCFCLSIIDYDCKWFRWPPNSPLLFNPATIYSSWKNTQTQTHMQILMGKWNYYEDKSPFLRNFFVLTILFVKIQNNSDQDFPSKVVLGQVKYVRHQRNLNPS